MSKLVIVGSSDLWVTPEIVSIVLGKVMTTEPGTVLGVRAPRSANTPVTQLEKFIWEVGTSLDRVAHMFIPISNKKSDTFKRDYELVEGALGVLAFFAPDQEMEGGTGHVVQAALARDIPVEAYRMADSGHPELLGSDDGLIAGDQFGITPSYPQTGGLVYRGTGTITNVPFTITTTYTGNATASGTSLKDLYLAYAAQPVGRRP